MTPLQFRLRLRSVAILYILALATCRYFHPKTISAEECGKLKSGALCQGGLCCSQYGWCGTTSPYCASGCQSQCWAPAPPPSPSVQPTSGSSMRRLAYFTNWASYRSAPYAFSPESIVTSHYTHLLYAFAAIKASAFTIIPSDPAIDLGPNPTLYPDKGFYFRFNRVAHAGKLKTLLSIGGGDSAATAAFSLVSKTSADRTKFTANTVAYARKYNFDGLDLDWELPDNPTDKTNFALLLANFRATITANAKKLNKTALLLTAAVAAWKPNVVASYDVPKLNKYLDWANVMTYDFHGSWEKKTGQHSAFTDSVDPSLSIKGAVQSWLALGLSRRKLVVGLAAYGRSWTLKTGSIHGEGAAAVGVGYGGPITQDSSGGSWAYFEINSFIRSGATVVFDQSKASVYAYKGSQWIGYDDTRTISLKAKYAQSQGFGGYMFWAMDLDDKFSLVAAAKAATK